MIPLNGARCFVNGTQVVDKTLLQHGDRIVWGNHHFFRVNCPRSATGGSIDFKIRSISFCFFGVEQRRFLYRFYSVRQQSIASRRLPLRTSTTTLPGRSLCLMNFRTIRFKELSRGWKSNTRKISRYGIYRAALISHNNSAGFALIMYLLLCTYTEGRAWKAEAGIRTTVSTITQHSISLHTVFAVRTVRSFER